MAMIHEERKKKNIRKKEGYRRISSEMKEGQKERKQSELGKKRNKRKEKEMK